MAEASQWRSIALALPLGALAALIAVLGASVNPLLVLAVIGGGLIFTLAYLRPLWVVYLAVLAVPLEFKLQNLGFFDLTASKGLFMVLAAAWITSQVVHRRPLILDTPLTLPLLGVIVVILPGLLIAENTLIVVNTLGTYVVMFCVFQAVVQDGDEQFVRRLFGVLAVLGIVLAALAITDSSFTAGSSTDTGAAMNRSDAGFGSPNALAAFLLLTIMPTLCMVFIGPVYRRLLAAGAGGIAGYGLLLTGSRGSFLGFIAGALMAVTWRPLRRAAILAIVVIAGLAIVGVNPIEPFVERSNIGERISSIAEAPESDPRAPVYRGTLEIIGDHPLFGIGANDYAAAAADYGISTTGFAPAHAHSAPLTIAADRGLIGLAAFLILVFALGRLFARGLSVATGERRAMLTGLMATFMATAAHNTVDYTLGAVFIGLLMVFAGSAVILARPAEDSEAPEPRHEPLQSLQPAGQPGA